MPTKKSLLPGFKREPGRSGRVKNLLTGETISDRQYKKLARGASGLTPLNEKGEKIVSNEALAKFNRQINESEALARPARGRTSARKLAPELQRGVVESRKEIEAAKRKAEKAAAEERAVQRKVTRAVSRKPKSRKHITASSFRRFKNGQIHRAAQVDFYDSSELEELVDEARSVRGIAFWGVGIQGLDERTGKELTAWLAGLFDMNYSYDADELEADTEDFLERKPYFIFTNWYAHFKLSQSYWESRNARTSNNSGGAGGKKKKR